MVETEAALGPALAVLRASMADPAVAVDLEWRADTGSGSSRVSLLQVTKVHAVRKRGQIYVVHSILRAAESHAVLTAPEKTSSPLLV